MYHASAAIAAVVLPEAVRKAAAAATALRGCLVQESVCLLGLREAIADLEKEHMVALSFEKLATGSPDGILKAKQTVLVIYGGSQNWSLQQWNPANESVPPPRPGLRQAQTFVDWITSTKGELEREEMHFVALVQRVQRQRQGISSALLSFNTLKLARGVFHGKIMLLLMGMFSSLRPITTQYLFARTLTPHPNTHTPKAVTQ